MTGCSAKGPGRPSFWSNTIRALWPYWLPVWIGGQQHPDSPERYVGLLLRRDTRWLWSYVDTTRIVFYYSDAAWFASLAADLRINAREYESPTALYAQAAEWSLVTDTPIEAARASLLRWCLRETKEGT